MRSTATKRHIFFALCLIAASSQAQPFIETKAGLSTRLAPVAYIDAGTMIRPAADYSGLLLAATTGHEAGFGTSIGAYTGWQFYSISFNAGITRWLPSSSKLENNKPYYPMVSVQYRDPQNRAVFDLRYMGNSIMFTMGFRFGKGHNE